jgi:hypothetical protein
MIKDHLRIENDRTLLLVKKSEIITIKAEAEYLGGEASVAINVNGESYCFYYHTLEEAKIFASNIWDQL